VSGKIVTDRLDLPGVPSLTAPATPRTFYLTLLQKRLTTWHCYAMAQGATLDPPAPA
jgi:hypothetical protein